jgi:hypothetical protein
MDTSLKPSQRVGIVGVVAPVSQGVGTVTTAWLDATTFMKFMAAINAGVLGAAATVDAKLQQATSNAGAGVKDVAAKAITQMVKATDDGKQVVINLKQEDLDFANGFKWFRLSITVGTAASLISALVVGLDPRYGPATDNDAATVKEVVA